MSHVTPSHSFLIPTDEAAELLGVSRRTMERWRLDRKGPNFVRLPNGVRYRVSDLTEWVDAHTVACGGVK